MKKQVEVQSPPPGYTVRRVAAGTRTQPKFCFAWVRTGTVADHGPCLAEQHQAVRHAWSRWHTTDARGERD